MGVMRLKNTFDLNIKDMPKTFKVNGKVYDIPDEKVESFLSKYKDAVEVNSFKVGETVYDIPLDKRDSFLLKYPDAKPLGKQPASPSGNGGASSSGQSQQPAQPTQPSGTASDPVQEEINRLQAKYESALKTNSNWLTDQENQRLITLKKSQQASRSMASATATKATVAPVPAGDGGEFTFENRRNAYLNMNKKVVDSLRGAKGDVIAKVASIDPEIQKIQSKINKIEESQLPKFQKEEQLGAMYDKLLELTNKQMSYIDPSKAVEVTMSPEEEALGRKMFAEKKEEAKKKIELAQSMKQAGESDADDKLKEAQQEYEFAEERLKEIDNGTYSPTIIPEFGKDMYHAPTKPGEFVSVEDIYSQFDIAKIQERSKLAEDMMMDPDSPYVRGKTVEQMRLIHEEKMKQVDAYRGIAPNVNERVGLDELLRAANENQGSIVDNLRAEGNVDRALRMLESDYMQYLKATDESMYDQYSQRMNEIDFKRSAGEPLTLEEQGFAKSFTQEALRMRQLSDLKKSKELQSGMDMRTFQLDGQKTLYDIKNIEKQIKEQSKTLNVAGDENITRYKEYIKEVEPLNLELSSISNGLQKYISDDGSINPNLSEADQAKAVMMADDYNKKLEQVQAVQAKYAGIFDADGNLIPGVNSQKLSALYSQYNTLVKQYEKIKQETGVNEQKLQELDNAFSSLGENKLASEFIDKGYVDLKIQEARREEISAERNRIAKEGTTSEKAGVLFDTMGTALATSLNSMLQAPKVISEMLPEATTGAPTDLFAEALYDWSTDFDAAISPYGSEITEGSGAFKFMNATAEAFGSYATSILFGGAGGVTTKALGGGVKMMKAAQATAGFMQGYLMSQGDAYRDALKAGLSPKEASVVANMVGVMSGVGETLFNEVDVFKPAQRYSLYSLIREKGFEDGLMEWAPQYVKSVFSEAAPEFFEESASEGLAQVVNNTVNGFVGEQVLQAGWNATAIVESGLSGALPPAFLSVAKVGTSFRTAQEQAALRNLAENGADVALSWASSGYATAEEMREIGDLARLAEDLGKIPAYAELTGDNKDRVFNLMQLKQSIISARKGSLLPLDEQDIKDIDAEVMSIYEQDKIIKQEAASVSDKPGNMDVGTQVMSGLVTTVYPTVGKVEAMMESEEFVNDKDIATAEDNLYTLLDDIDKRDDITDEQKLSMSRVIEERIQKIQDYEYRSKTKSSTATQSRPSGVIEKVKTANERASAPVRTAAIEGISVAYNGIKGKMKMSDGTMVDNTGETIPDGYYVFIPEGTDARAGRVGAVVVGPQQEVDEGLSFESIDNNPSWAPDNNIVVNMTMPDGGTVSIMDDDLSADVGIRQSEEVIGLAPQAMFDTVFEEVSTEFKAEQPYLKSDDQKNKQGVSGGVGGQQASVQNQPDQGTGTEASTSSGVVQATEEIDFGAAEEMTPEEEGVMASEYDDAVAAVLDMDDTLDDDDVDTAAGFVQMGATPQEAIRMVREDRAAIEQASQPAPQPQAKQEQVPQVSPLKNQGEYTASRKAELKNKYKDHPKAEVLGSLDKAARAFKKTFGKDTKVFVFETAREMHDALVAQGRDTDFDPNENGAFAYNEGGDVVGVYLNMENADAVTAPHEFVHNVLLEVFGEDSEVYVKFRDDILEMFKESDIDRLKNWAEENYDEESSPEEFITELTAQLAATNKELALPTTLIDRFKDIVNSVFKSVAGMNVFSDRATKKDVVEFINAMASGLSTGSAIDLQAGKRLAKERAKESAKSKPVSGREIAKNKPKAMSSVSRVNAAMAMMSDPDMAVEAGMIMEEVYRENPSVAFVMENFDKIEKALVKEGKLKVNCEL